MRFANRYQLHVQYPVSPHNQISYRVQFWYTYILLALLPAHPL